MIDTADVKGFVARIVQRYVRKASQKPTRTKAAIMGQPHKSRSSTGNGRIGFRPTVKPVELPRNSDCYASLAPIL